jgi:hypothetical protein
MAVDLAVAPLGVPPKPRTRSADRTRSRRWRAGTRRARRRIAAARRQGLPHPFPPPRWTRWQTMGAVVIFDETHAWRR